MRFSQQAITNTTECRQLLSRFMPALLLVGLVVGADAQACISSADADANGCINEVRVESPQMSVTGQSAYVQPGTAVQFTAQAFSGATPTSNRGPTDCDHGWDWQVYNPLGDVIDPASIVINGNQMSIAAENNPGIGRVQATCRDNPSITDEVTVQAGGFSPLRTPAVAVAAGGAAAVAAGGQAAGNGSFNPGAQAAQPPAVPRAGGPSQGAKVGLLVGAIVGGGLLIGAAASAADTTTSSGGGGECAHITYNGCCSGATIGDGAADCGVSPPCGCPSGTVQIGTYNGQATCSCQ